MANRQAEINDLFEGAEAPRNRIEIREVDPEVVVAELEQGMSELEREIGFLEDAQEVSQEVMELVVSV